MASGETQLTTGDRKRPLYKGMMEIMERRIRSGQLAPGAKAPSESDLIAEFRVSSTTARRCLDELERLRLVRRVQGRRVCKACGTNVSAFGANPSTVARCERCGGELVTRSDDTEAVVRERLRVYWRDTRPMIEYYSHRPTFRVIDGAQEPEQVRQALVAAVMGVAKAAGLSVPPGARV